MSEPREGPVAIKKYANRRLYNTATSSYVTLDHLSQMVRDGIDFTVCDAKSGDDITRAILTQIIVEEENKRETPLLPIGFLRQLISFYGDSLGSLLPRYLDHSMQSFMRHREQMRDVMQNALGGMFPMSQFEELNKQNLAFFENAMKMFVRFYGDQGSMSTPVPDHASVSNDVIEDLREKLEAMQQQLDSFLKKP